jgi:E3 ubiquitin-protein ligase makorin
MSFHGLRLVAASLAVPSVSSTATRHFAPSPRMSATTCKFYLAGTCRNGAACRFSHDAEGARAATPTRERCKFVDAPGGCSFGDRCKYAHDARDARALDVTEAVGKMTLDGRARGMSAGAMAFEPSARGGAGAGGAPASGLEYEEEDEDWGYVDECGNWVSFDDEGEGAREFLAAQLPDEDELLGMTSEGPSGVGDAWGYFDEGGNWVSLEGEGQEYLQTQEDLVR